MKTILSLLGAPLATATAIAIAGALALTALPAHAGCGLTVTFDNDLKTSIKVLEVDSKTTTGSWSTVYTSDFTVDKGKKVVKAIETTAGCTLPQHLRVKYEKGSNTFYKTKGPLATVVDKQIRIEFDD
jgi:hypothetical protein